MKLKYEKLPTYFVDCIDYIKSINMLIYGSGGTAKVIIDGLFEKGEAIETVFDHDTKKTSLLGIKIEKEYDSSINPAIPLLIALSDNSKRKAIVQKIKHSFGIFIHGKASFSKLSKIGEGSIVGNGSIVSAGTHVGKHTIINSNVTVDHDCEIGDFVYIASTAALSGDVHVGEGTVIGPGAKIIPHVKIGKNCIIGAGAVITHSVPDNKLVFPPHFEIKDRTKI